jgi:hypothetical protein
MVVVVDIVGSDQRVTMSTMSRVDSCRLDNSMFSSYSRGGRTSMTLLSRCCGVEVIGPLQERSGGIKARVGV